MRTTGSVREQAEPDLDQVIAQAETAPPTSVYVTSDHLELPLTAAASVLVLSDLHLHQRQSAASRQIEADICTRLADATAAGRPGVVVLNGDLVEMWGEPEGTVGGALDAHPLLTLALHTFARSPGCQVVAVVGNHDGPLAWDNQAAQVLARRLGCVTTMVLDLRFTTPAGERVVRCEHGHAYDPVNQVQDCRNPLDSPLGQHIAQEVLPQATSTPLLADLGQLGDPNASLQFAGSRFLYREIGSRAWWLLIPVLVSLLLRLPMIVRSLSHHTGVSRIDGWLIVGSVGIVINVIGVAVILAVLARAVYASVASSSLGPRGAHSNGAPRTAAAALCAQGFAGLITSHTHQPELSPIPGGFYANSGCCQRMVEARPARFGLPAVFETVLRRSWIELDVERDLRVRLVLAESPGGELTWLERIVARRRPVLPAAPEVIATLPGDPGWPLRSLDLDRRRSQERVRAGAAVAVTAVALLSLASALTLPLRGRLAALLDVLPIEVPQTAAASVAFLSVALILLARGLRRGHRLAWGLAVGILTVSAVLHILKGIDVEEAATALVAALWLARERSAFPVRRGGRQSRWPGWVTLWAGGVLAVSIALVALTGEPSDARLSSRAVAERLLGNSSIPLPSTQPFLTPALLATGFALLLACGLVLTRHRRARELTPAQRGADLQRARRLVTEHGGDTLAYFALRDDKTWFFTGDCVVAYDLRDGVCLVSPDPIGPPEQWATAWAEFAAFADRHGWPVTVIGASAGWLPIYQAAGLRSMYIGDEAIVDCSAFTLEGRPMKGLRSAYHRVQRAGYTVQFYDPATLTTEFADELRSLLDKSRHGQVERGFSMTLSRAFEPEDTGLLLAVASGPDGKAAGFCQWAPAADISGWSLDLMRRSNDSDLPNGLTDFIIIETINRLKAHGQWGLSLNFAVMRSILAGEQGGGVLTDLQRRVLVKFSDSMQIASLWHYNDKFKPIWRPRYVAIGRLTSAPSQSLAIADAEGVSELPLIGRFLGRSRHPAAETD